MAKRQRIRAVLDTNLFVSGLFASHGSVAELQQLWISGAFELAVSEKILEEIEETLQKPSLLKLLHLKQEEIPVIIAMIREKAFVVTGDRYITNRITADPDDNKFLACSLEIGADYIVSGDNHLLALKHFHRTQIVDAQTFIKKVKKR